MSFIVPSRRVAALAVAASGLSAVLAGAFAPAASAATPSAPAAAASTVAAKATDWFVDPRTPAERKAEIAVPKNPKKYRGKVRETRAVYRTRKGDLAVPMRFAIGNKVQDGQAVTLDGEGLFVVNTVRLTPAAKSQLNGLAEAFDNAAAIRCEGYADYAGTAAHNVVLARGRANAVCDFMADSNPGLKTSAVSYGPKWPAVVGGDSEDRRLNRRVVVGVTNARPVVPNVPVVPPAPVEPPAPQAKVPGAPVLRTVKGHVGTATYAYTAPTDDGGSPITAYEVTTGDGWTPVVELLPAKGTDRCLTSCEDHAGWRYGVVADLPEGALLDLRVRARNKVGAGAPSNTLPVAVQGRPGAPSLTFWMGIDGVITTTFAAPEKDGNSPITGYQVRYDGGDPLSLDLDLTDPETFSSSHEGFANGTLHTVEVRALNQWGEGAWSEVRTVLVTTVPDAPSLDDEPVVDAEAGTATFLFEKPEFDGGTPITGYEVTTDGGAHWNPLTFTETSSGYSFELSDLVLGHEYAVQIRALNARGDGVPSKTRTIVASALPEAPTNVAATVDGTTVTLTFDTPLDGGPGLHYEVAVDGGPFVEATPADGKIVLTNQPAGPHTYAVRAVNTRGASDGTVSNEVTVVVAPAVLPGTPTIAKTASNRDYLWVYWTPGDPGNQTITWEASIDGGPWHTFNYEPFIEEGYTFAELTPDCGGENCADVLTTVRVRATTPAGSSEPSPVFRFRPAEQPAAPTALQRWGMGAAGDTGYYGLMFTPGATNGATVTGWEGRIDGGVWVPLINLEDVDGNVFGHLTYSCELDCEETRAGHGYAEVRAVTADGHSPASGPAALHLPEDGGMGIPGGDPASLPDGS